jgi:hypothetical protein
MNQYADLVRTVETPLTAYCLLGKRPALCNIASDIAGPSFEHNALSIGRLTVRAHGRYFHGGSFDDRGGHAYL